MGLYRAGWRRATEADQYIAKAPSVDVGQTVTKTDLDSAYKKWDTKGLYINNAGRYIRPTSLQFTTWGTYTNTNKIEIVKPCHLRFVVLGTDSDESETTITISGVDYSNYARVASGAAPTIAFEVDAKSTGTMSIKMSGGTNCPIITGTYIITAQEV